MSSQENSQEIEKFDELELMKIDSKDSTLAIDVVSEWSKGYKLINMLIKELYDERYIDYIEDSKGGEHKVTKSNPLLLQYMKERRVLEDQFWKFIGGDVANEAKKESVKELAKQLFNFSIDSETKEKFKKQAIKIIEAEFNEENENSS